MNKFKNRINYCLSFSTLLSKPSGTGNCVGRSMIEMLGVLAIIGVLSVGGIAGYSKAMEQFRINKAISEYSYLIYGMLEHLDDFKKTTTGMTEEAEVFTVAQSLNLVPQSWSRINNLQYKDSLGNMIQLWILPEYGLAENAKVLTFDFYLGGVTPDNNNKNVSANFSAKLCMDIYQKIAIPLHNVAWDANISIVPAVKVILLPEIKLATVRKNA